MSFPPRLNPKQDGDLDRLPPEHQRLVDQERRRIARVMSALVIDHELPNSELGLIIVADIGSELGKVFASVFCDVREVIDEIRNAAIQRRRPVVVEGIWGETAVECLKELVQNGLERAETRTPGSIVLLVVSSKDEPVASFVLPVVHEVGPGAN